MASVTGSALCLLSVVASMGGLKLPRLTLLGAFHRMAYGTLLVPVPTICVGRDFVVRRSGIDLSPKTSLPSCHQSSSTLTIDQLTSATFSVLF